MAAPSFNYTMVEKAERLALVAKVAKMAGNARTKGVMSSPPTVTAAGTTNPITSPVSKLVASAPSIFTAAGALAYGGGTYRIHNAVIGSTGGNVGLSNGFQNSCSRVSIMADATKVAFKVLPSATPYRFLVDDQYVDLTGTTTLASSGTTLEYIGLDFTSAGGKAVRKITIEMQQLAGLDGVYADAAGRIYPVAKPQSYLRAASLGDSFIGGSAMMTAYGDLYCIAMADRLGIDQMLASGSGGTKWGAPSGSAYAFETRIANGDLAIAGSPDLIFLMASVNNYADTSAAIQAGAQTGIASARSLYPDALIFVFGCYNSGSGSTAQNTASENAVFAGVDASGVTKGIVKIPITTDTNGAWLTSANKADIIGADNTHMTDAGNATAARWQAEAVLTSLASMQF